MTSSWVMLAGLGAFHGINPGMGWLFAVALGMQERRRGAVLMALVPLGAGHALAVAAAIAVAAGLGAVVPLASLRWPVGLLLVALGVARAVRHRHPRWAGMRVSAAGLTWWSFLMATAHGAGLMVVPIFLGMAVAGAEGGGSCHMPAGTGSAVTALVATACTRRATSRSPRSWRSLVFEKLGVGLLRRAWFNLDLVWAAALVVTGILTIAI